ncbi:hypothetical protein [Pseudacidovorax intermedius]|uniref:hypothetical protein n=1 Tax=Pseudacidovorax intermedius TaxID=433924 RepID=UPI00128FB177|nr:hypothetical protein [Pseudacidovorax intermedius]
MQLLFHADERVAALIFSPFDRTSIVMIAREDAATDTTHLQYIAEPRMPSGTFTSASASSWMAYLSHSSNPKTMALTLCNESVHACTTQHHRRPAKGAPR